MQVQKYINFPVFSTETLSFSGFAALISMGQGNGISLICNALQVRKESLKSLMK